MQRVLFVGENPLGTSGNSNMMSAVLDQLDTSKFDPVVFAAVDIPPARLFDRYKFNIIPARGHQDDPWGQQRLTDLVYQTDFDILCMVGIDIWRYSGIMNAIVAARSKKKFKWVWLFPYDLVTVREDWIRWINMVDIPCVYSQYGFNLIRKFVPALRYFRPALKHAEVFRPLKNRMKARSEVFPDIAGNDKTIFGFIGNNQVRKDPQALIRAYKIVSDALPEKVHLYMHTDLGHGAFNLAQFLADAKIKTGEVTVKIPARDYDQELICKIYNSMDCLVNCSMQEGLSWTPLEAMLCGTPVIASDSTSHPELLHDVGILVPCKRTGYVPLVTKSGTSMVEGPRCDPEDIAKAMIEFVKNKPLRNEMRERGLKKGDEWLAGISDINELFGGARRKRKINKVLFGQHSSAGDVLMTTRCFKGIKERFKDIPIVYMTMPQFAPLIEGNPYIDEVIQWNEAMSQNYKYVLTPHKDVILNGHWSGSNSRLSDFYWKLMGLEPGDFYVPLQPKFNDGKGNTLLSHLKGKPPIVVVHTTGGDPRLRMFQKMPKVVKKLKGYYTIQLGGRGDFPANADLDLRGVPYPVGNYVMSRAKYAITVDSYMSHLAGALGIPQVCIVSCGNVASVQPVQMKRKCICLTPDYVYDCYKLGPCAGLDRGCKNPCMFRYEPEDILEAFHALEKTKSTKPKVEIWKRNSNPGGKK